MTYPCPSIHLKGSDCILRDACKGYMSHVAVCVVSRRRRAARQDLSVMHEVPTLT